MKITEGCIAWFDVGRQGQGREMFHLTPLGAGAPADYLIDASGQGHHLLQSLAASRPVLRQNGTHSWLSFDGQDDFLAASGWNESLTNATVFVVAAPRSNPGFFRALLSFNRAGRNDYQSGFNLDLGGKPSPNFAVLNTEGPGFGGEKNLLNSPLPFGHWNTFTLVTCPGVKGVKLFVDGQPQGTRDRAADSVLRADEFRLGARHYDNSGGFPAAGSFFDGELAEVLVFNRALPDADRAAIEA